MTLRLDFDADRRLGPGKIALLEAIQRLVGSDLALRPYPYLHEGQRVRVAVGPLTGVEGILVRSRPNRGLFVLSVNLLHRSVAVEVDCTTVLAQVRASLKIAVDESGVAIHVADLPGVSGSAEHLALLFGHLIDNAIKHRSPDRPGRGRSQFQGPGGRARQAFLFRGFLVNVTCPGHTRAWGAANIPRLPEGGIHAARGPPQEGSSGSRSIRHGSPRQRQWAPRAGCR